MKLPHAIKNITLNIKCVPYDYIVRTMFNDLRNLWGQLHSELITEIT